jgi:hypothetical protein
MTNNLGESQFSVFTQIKRRHEKQEGLNTKFYEKLNNIEIDGPWANHKLQTIIFENVSPPPSLPNTFLPYYLCPDANPNLSLLYKFY